MVNDHNLTVGYGACSKPTQKITSISVLQRNKYCAMIIYRINIARIVILEWKRLSFEKIVSCHFLYHDILVK